MQPRRYMSLAVWATERRELKEPTAAAQESTILPFPSWRLPDDAPVADTPAERNPAADSSRDAA